MFNSTNITLSPDVDQDTYGKQTKTQKHNTQENEEVKHYPACDHKAARNTQEANQRLT